MHHPSYPSICPNVRPLNSYPFQYFLLLPYLPCQLSPLRQWSATGYHAAQIADTNFYACQCKKRTPQSFTALSSLVRLIQVFFERALLMAILIVHYFFHKSVMKMDFFPLVMNTAVFLKTDGTDQTKLFWPGFFHRMVVLGAWILKTNLTGWIRKVGLTEPISALVCMLEMVLLVFCSFIYLFIH